MWGRKRQQPAAGCCWVTGGQGPICAAHERAVGEAVNRDAAVAGRSAVERFGLLSGTPDIDRDRPDSDAPGLIEERRSDQ